MRKEIDKFPCPRVLNEEIESYILNNKNVYRKRLQKFVNQKKTEPESVWKIKPKFL